MTSNPQGSLASIPKWLRWIALWVLCGYVALMFIVVAHANVRNFFDEDASTKNPFSWKTAPWRSATLDKSHPRRDFMTTVEIRQDHTQVVATVIHQLTLKPNDRLLNQFRASPDGFILKKALSSIVGTVITWVEGPEVEADGWTLTISQKSPDSNALITARGHLSCALARCHPITVQVEIGPPSWGEVDAYKLDDRGYTPERTTRRAKVLLENWPVQRVSGASASAQHVNTVSLLLGSRAADITGIMTGADSKRVIERWYDGPGQPGDPRNISRRASLVTVFALSLSVLTVALSILNAVHHPPSLQRTFPDQGQPWFAIGVLMPCITTLLLMLAGLSIPHLFFLFLLSVLIAGVPFLVLRHSARPAGSGRGRRWFSVDFLIPSIIWVALLASIPGYGYYYGHLDSRLSVLCAVLVPSLAAWLLWLYAPIPAVGRAWAYRASVAVYACLSIFCFALDVWTSSGFKISPYLLPLIVGLTAYFYLRLRRRSSGIPHVWANAAVVSATIMATWRAYEYDAGIYYTVFDAPSGLMAALSGTLWLPALILMLVTDSPTFRRSRRRLVAAAGVCVVLYLPVVDPHGGYGRYWDLGPESLHFGYALVSTDAAACVAILAATLLLRHRGQDSQSGPDRRMIPVVASVLVLAGEPIVVSSAAPFRYLAVVALAIAISFTVLLAPKRRMQNLDELLINSNTHLMRVQDFAERELMSRAQQRLARDAGATIAGNEGSVEDFRTKWRAMNTPVSGASSASDPFSHERRALGSNAGLSPWALGRMAAVSAFVLSLPMILYDLWAVRGWFVSLTLVQILDLLRHSLRWVGYGFVYGHFYPMIPGRAPMAKAARLLAAIAAPEVLLVLFPQSTGAGNLGIAVLLRLGESVAFCMLLGLWWERKIAVTAQLPWAAIRNLRSVTALGAPAAAVTVAAVTTLATALAGAATVALLHSPTAQEPDQSGSPTPSVSESR
ncbi:hypothetical protein [Streptomyces sp. NPDC047043]|uniref:hypothetical protein n=1 Tax=Streptomyces sp. NPDC047043 TaxID=3154497 RepID=UPI0033EA8DB3